MEEKKVCKKKSVFGYILGSVLLVVAGAVALLPILKKFRSRLYKSSLENEEIDFDNLGPEIVKRDKNKETV